MVKGPRTRTSREPLYLVPEGVGKKQMLRSQSWSCRGWPPSMRSRSASWPSRRPSEGFWALTPFSTFLPTSYWWLLQLSISRSNRKRHCWGCTRRSLWGTNQHKKEELARTYRATEPAKIRTMHSPQDTVDAVLRTMLVDWLRVMFHLQHGILACAC